MSKDGVKYENNILNICYSNYGAENRNYDALFDFLGDFDIVTASELGNDVIIMSNEVFNFSHQDEQKLRKNTFVELEKISSLNEFIDNNNEEHIDFMKWYNS